MPRPAALLIAVAIATTTACKREEAPPPKAEPSHARILRFEPSTLAVAINERVTLAWKTEQAQSAIITASDGRVLQASNEQAGLYRTEPLTAGATFTLTAKSEDGIDSIATAEVAVLTQPDEVAILRFNATPLTVSAGQTTALSWEVAHATAVKIEGVLENAPASGSAMVQPLATTTFRLIAQGVNGPKTAMLNVVVDEMNVDPPPPVGACADPAFGPEIDEFVEVTDAFPRPIIPPVYSYFGSGAGLADLDRDGLIDVVIPTRGGPTAVFRNIGGLHFEELPDRAGIDALDAASGVTLGDLDNDGDDDLLLLGTERALLYENDGTGTFHNRTSAAIEMLRPAEAALFADLDNDGLLEILVNMYGREASPTDFGALRDHLLYNRGAFDFEDVTEEAGIEERGKTWASSVFDVDQNGTLDLYIANDTFSLDFGGGNLHATALEHDLVYLNNSFRGALQMSEASAGFGFDVPHSSMGSLVGDFDGDGSLDLYVSNYGMNPLYLAQSDGTYAERAEELGVAAIRRNSSSCEPTNADCLLVSWGAVFEDFDNDGSSELMVANGAFTGDRAQPTLMFVKTPGSDPVRYEARDPRLGCVDGRAILPADLDNDGDLDLVFVIRNEPVRIYENRTPSENGWLRVTLEGGASNRAGIGAVLGLQLDDGAELVRAIGTGGVIYSSRTAEAHFGLGAKNPVALEVRWPSGRTQRVTDLERNRSITVVEPD